MPTMRRPPYARYESVHYEVLVHSSAYSSVSLSPSASHIRVTINSVSLATKCLAPPNACSFGVSCLQVPHTFKRLTQVPIRSVSRVPECFTHSSVPYNDAYPFSVSCLQLSHIIMLIHSVYRVFSCLT